MQSSLPHLKMRVQTCIIYIRIIHPDISRYRRWEPVRQIQSLKYWQEWISVTSDRENIHIRHTRRNIRQRVLQPHFPHLDTGHMHCMIIQVTSIAVPMSLTIWDLIHLPVRSSWMSFRRQRTAGRRMRSWHSISWKPWIHQIRKTLYSLLVFRDMETIRRRRWSKIQRSRLKH